MSEFIIVFSTFPNFEQAKKAADSILLRKVAACCNIVNEINSIFWWQNKIEETEEVLLMAKTKMSLFENLKSVIRDNHSYDVPEIIAIPIVAGYDEYLNWIDESVC